MIPHPILNSRRDDVSAIELRSIQHIDCTKNHFTSDAVEDEGGCLPHDSRAGKTPCRARSGSPSPCKLGETKASMDAKVSLRRPPSEINACANAFVSPSLFSSNLVNPLPATLAANQVKQSRQWTRISRWNQLSAKQWRPCTPMFHPGFFTANEVKQMRPWTR